MIFGRTDRQEYGGGVYLTTVYNSVEADILEATLKANGIPSLRNAEGAGDCMGIVFGGGSTNPIDIYVPKDRWEDAKALITAAEFTEEEILHAMEEDAPETNSQK